MYVDYITALYIVIVMVVFSGVIAFAISWKLNKIQHIVIEWNKDKKAKVYKAKKLNDKLLQLDRNNYVVVTTTPLYYKNKRYYFVYEGDLHTVDIKDGKVIDENLKKEYIKDLVNEIAKKMKEEGKTPEEIRLYIKENIEPVIEDLSPHKFTKLVIAKIVQQKIFEALLSSLGRRLFEILLALIVGFLAGQVLSNYLLIFKIIPYGE